MVNTDYLRYFVAVAEELHFGRAAERLFMAQQPLSRQIKRLEAELGVQLFERTTRRVALTPAGRAFLEEVRYTLTALERAVKTAQRAARGELGTLRVGYTATALYNVLPSAIRAFREQVPDVQLELIEMSSAKLEQALLANDIQAALLYGAVPSPGINNVTLSVEPLIAVLPDAHPLAASETVSLRDLAGDPFVFFPRYMRPSLLDQIIGFCRSAGFSPRIVQEAAPEQTIIGMVASGIGVALVFACLQNLNRPGVVYRRLADVDTAVEFNLAWRSDEGSPALRLFAEVVQKV